MIRTFQGFSAGEKSFDRFIDIMLCVSIGNFQEADLWIVSDTFFS